MTEVTDRNERRAELAAGGWTVLYGDLINEWDVVTGLASIPLGVVGGWVTQQVQAQLQKFQRSQSDVSQDVINQATDYLKHLLQKKQLGEKEFDGLGVKAGILRYHRYTKWPGGIKTPLPDNYQPYIGVRVTKAASPSESKNRPTPLGKSLGSRLQLTDQIMKEGDYLQSENNLYRFICQGDGNVVLYGPAMAVIWQSHTDGMGHPPFRIVAQSDRNVVQYDGRNTALWRTGTSTTESGHSRCVLILQDDRNLVLYEPGDHWKALWATHTAA